MSEHAPADTRLIASLHTADGKGIVRVEDRFDTDIDDLWSALTEPARLSRWLADVQGDLRRGGEFRAHFTSGFDGAGRIEVCDPPRRLSVRMSPGQPDEMVIEAQLSPEGERTVLVIEDRGLPVDELPLHGAGWQAHVEDLAAHVARRAAADWSARWTELTPGYQQLGVEPV